MSLILRKDIGRKLTIEELDGNFEWLSENGGAGATGPQGEVGPTGPGSTIDSLINETIEIEIPLDPVGMITAVDYTKKLTRFITGTFTGFYSNTFSDPVEISPGACLTLESKSYKGQFDYNFSQNGGYGYGGYNPTSPLKTNFDYTIGIVSFNNDEASARYELKAVDTNVGGMGCFYVSYIAERQCYGCDQPIGQHTFNFNNSGVASCGCYNDWVVFNNGGQINGDGCVTSCWGCMWCCGGCPGC